MGFSWRSKRRNRKTYRVPDPPDDSLRETVRDHEETAEKQLSHAQAREDVIDAKRAKLLQIRRDNALGPRFWEAVGEHRRA